jgi:puromycin-sensitive aminopeptidase
MALYGSRHSDATSLYWVSHLNNPFRLPRTVLPSRYEVSLTPDLDAAIFTGTVTIAANAIAAASEIVMNAIELDIASVSVNGLPATFSLHEESERLIIDAAVAQGPCSIAISFTGILNDKLRGFYRSTFTDDSGIVRTIATTQMQATDCRRAFPCFDEPDFKAVFAIDLTIKNEFLAVSNSSEVRREATGNDSTRIWFADTMIMSTYLVAFVVGPLEASATEMVGDISVRIIHVPGKSHLTEFGMRAGTFALDWFQTYYGVPYPSDKVDLLALPDFAAGAMENVGCITFREVLLLVDPETSTQVEQELVALVVAHELAHMWFGDLVTMSWWNGIWLNEAFATFMEYAACDAFMPQWKLWTSFGLDRSAAFDVDSLHSTRTIEFPVNSPADADGMFDVLTYQKGGAILRMLEQYIGPDRFRAGVSHYLKTHAYGNTETNDLWDAIEHVVSTDGGPIVPVRRLMDSWIWQAGYPLISVRIDGTDLVISQRQFTFDNQPDVTLWVVPIHVRIGTTSSKVLLETDEMRIPLSDTSAAIVVNANGPGFFRVEYSAELLRRITGATLSSLDTLERYNLVDDAWNAVIAGAMNSDAYIAFLMGFTEEQDLAVWQTISASLKSLSRIIPAESEPAFATFVSQLVSPALARLGWTPVKGEEDLVAKLRGLIVQQLAIYGKNADAQRQCRDILFNNSTTEPELVAAATNVVAATGDSTDYEWFLGRYRDPSTPQDQIRMLYALAEFDSPELIARTCDFALTSEVKTQNAPFLLNRCIANRKHGEQAWSFVRQNWQHANDAFPGNTIIRMASATATLNSDVMEADIQSFFSERPIVQAGKMLDQVLERQRVNTDLRRRESSVISQALKA